MSKKSRGVPLPPGGASPRPDSLLGGQATNSNQPTWTRARFPKPGDPVVLPTASTETLPPNTTPEQLAGEVFEVPIELIDPSPFQPRLSFDEGELEALAASIDELGLSNHILVRRKGDGRYELIGGERRLRAFKILGRTSVTVSLRNVDDARAAVLAVTDNTARKNLSDYEMGKGFNRLLCLSTADGSPPVRSKREIARISGISEGQVRRCLQFLELPQEVIEILENQPNLFGANTAEAFAIAARSNPSLVVQAVKRIGSRGMSETAAVRWVKGQMTREQREDAGKAFQAELAIAVSGKTLCNANVKGRKVILDCVEGVDPQVFFEWVTTQIRQGIFTYNGE